MRILKVIYRNFQLLFSRIYYSCCHRDKRLWVLGEWFGERCCDNCLYFANWMTKNHPEIKLVWITKKETNCSLLGENIVRLVMDTPEAICSLKKAGVVFMVHGLQDLTNGFVLYFSGALVINFWHGVPWKKIHFDMPRTFLQTLSLKFLTQMTGAKFYLSTSQSFDGILHTAFDCDSQHIIKSGYPRNNLFYNSNHFPIIKTKLLNYIKGQYDNIADDIKIITYMPTFRDTQSNVFSFDDITNNVRLNTVLKKNKAIIIQKSHYISLKRNSQSVSSDSNFVFLSDYPTQELLAASDILITDYSSCFFDYLLLDRPIIHYIYDYDYYSNDDRGLYYTKEEAACGDVVDSVEDLIDAIEVNLSNPKRNSELRKERQHRFLQYESSGSCGVIYEALIKFLSNYKDCASCK